MFVIGQVIGQVKSGAKNKTRCNHRGEWIYQDFIHELKMLDNQILKDYICDYILRLNAAKI